MNIGVGILLWVPGTLKLRQGASLPSLHLGGVPGTLKTAQDEAKPSRQQTSGTLETSHPLGGDEAGTLKNVKRTRDFQVNEGTLEKGDARRQSAGLLVPGTLKILLDRP